MVIRMRHTRAHTRNRRSHHALKGVTLSTCSNCKGHTRPHHMCLSCGFYKGRQVLDLTTLKTSRDARIKAKQDLIRVESGKKVATGPEIGHTEAPADEHVHEHEHDHGEEKPEKAHSRRVTSGASSKKRKGETS